MSSLPSVSSREGTARGVTIKPPTPRDTPRGTPRGTPRVTPRGVTPRGVTPRERPARDHMITGGQTARDNRPDVWRPPTHGSRTDRPSTTDQPLLSGRNYPRRPSQDSVFGLTGDAAVEAQKANSAKMKFKVPDNPLLYNELMLQFRSPRAWEAYYNLNLKEEEEASAQTQKAIETHRTAEVQDPKPEETKPAPTRPGRKLGVWELPLHSKTPRTSRSQQDFAWHTGRYRYQGVNFDANKKRDQLTIYTEAMLRARQRIC
eukprot:CAMPEP_0114562902 /NCGR_PEP_ID=MMETSP0114-20121206/12788_1 /TAXON_ID=31324 /ORGANISM="Goniomonas sp, Strain m" /LENGTH=259 /DNA_ID=CAMNT_0001748641 /DNA_START=9 /DNA_END=788 /DNA_ORIENTATION=+